MKSRLLATRENDDAVCEQLWSGDLPSFVERLLSSTIANVALLPSINDFIRAVIAVLCDRLKSQDTMTPGRLQMLSRVLGYAKCVLLNASLTDA